MKRHFQLFTEENRNKYLSARYNINDDSGNQKEDRSLSFAHEIEICESLEDVSNIKARYVIIGIPEDIGVRANLGRAGASEAWNSFLKSFLLLQHTSLNDAGRFCLLGNVLTQDLMEQAVELEASQHSDRIRLSDLVKIIDQRVSEIATLIFDANKIPVVIGGGHNNSYPLLRSCGYTDPVDCINIDAHTDLRAAKGRHSGNGFSHAIEENYLNSYYIMGIQENYLSQSMVDLMESNVNINYSAYGSIHGDEKNAVQVALPYINSMRFALEIDMDVVAGFPSSAQSPVGYSFQELRNLMNEIIAQASKFPQYIHICEAAPEYGYENQVGKALATLVNDLP